MLTRANSPQTQERPATRTNSRVTTSTIINKEQRFGETVDPVVQRTPACACGGGCPRCLGVQTKLKVNPPGDRYEQEADNLADQVMRMPAPIIQRAPT